MLEFSRRGGGIYWLDRESLKRLGMEQGPLGVSGFGCGCSPFVEDKNITKPV